MLSSVSPDSILIVLGSGMSACFAPEEIEVFGSQGRGSVEGHPGLLARTEIAGCPVVLALGRRHLYEGCSRDEITALVRAAGERGVRRLILTNAAGGLNPLLRTGDLMLHIGYLPLLLGRFAVEVFDGSQDGNGEAESVTARSLAACDLYPEIIERGLGAGLPLREGSYAAVLGPSYETRAEIRALRRLGADAVGMSTYLEARAAARFGMRTIGLSLITNEAKEVAAPVLSHDDVVDESRRAIAKVRRFLQIAVAVLRR